MNPENNGCIIIKIQNGNVTADSFGLQPEHLTDCLLISYKQLIDRSIAFHGGRCKDTKCLWTEFSKKVKLEIERIEMSIDLTQMKKHEN